jgi:hypothetical protein
MPITLNDLMTMSDEDRFEVLRTGHPLEPDALVDTAYLGVELSLPGWVQRHVLWKTFRKAFVRDEPGGEVRGWNVRMEQNGIDGDQRPLLRGGRPRTFGHYVVRSAAGLPWPRGWTGAHFLDYGTAGNPWWDPARLGYTPLVAVNEGSQELLLGWELFKIGPTLVQLPSYWALRRHGPIEHRVPRPGAPGSGRSA